MDFNYKILNIKKIKSKKGQLFNCIQIYASWSDKVLNVFVSDEIYDMIVRGELNDDNIGPCIRFRYQDGELKFSIDID